jgi:hypothetical protein
MQVAAYPTKFALVVVVDTECILQPKNGKRCVSEILACQHAHLNEL